MYKMYGIKNCSTVIKAMNFLEDESIEFEFVDFKKYSPSKSDIDRWMKTFGDWPVNKNGRTFKQNKESFEGASDANKYELISEKSSMIKRPILEKDGKPIVFGFNEDDYSKVL